MNIFYYNDIKNDWVWKRSPVLTTPGSAFPLVLQIFTFFFRLSGPQRFRFGSLSPPSGRCAWSQHAAVFQQQQQKALKTQLYSTGSESKHEHSRAVSLRSWYRDNSRAKREWIYRPSSSHVYISNGLLTPINIKNNDVSMILKLPVWSSFLKCLRHEHLAN